MKMKKIILILLISCVIVIGNNTRIISDTKDCECSIVVECYYPGYQSGIDLPFASQTVNSCAEAKEYMRYMSETVKYPNDWIEIFPYSPPVFFFLYPAKS